MLDRLIPAAAHAVLDTDGRLIEADAPLLALNARAGGVVGAPLAVPALATAVRLARRLRVALTRKLLVANGDHDIELWVKVKPSDDGLRLSASGWREIAAHPRSAPIVDGDDAWRWDCDAELRLTSVSLAAGRRHGIDPVGLLGHPLTVLFAFIEPGAGAPMLAGIAARQSFDGQQATLQTGGSRVTLSGQVRRDAAGRFAGFTGFAREAEPSGEDEPLGHFTSQLDRALRAPLARIIADAEAINAGGCDGLRREYVEYAADIGVAGRHLLGLVDDLVDLDALEREEFAPAQTAFDLADTARRSATMLAVRAGDAGVRLAVATPFPVGAIGDPGRTLQILVNLIGNAVRYSPRGSDVEIGVALLDGAATVEVSDRGKGIAAEDQDRIFAKFERVDPREAGGSGLGLHIARRLARAMAGDVTVASALGEGARFTLTLPAQPPREQDH